MRRRRARETARRAALTWVHRSLAVGWQSWWAAVERRATNLERVRRGVARWRAYRVARVWLTWSEAAAAYSRIVFTLCISLSALDAPLAAPGVQQLAGSGR